MLCEQHFDALAMSGQDLLDDLRRAQLLPLSTVFVMVTGEASYAKVAEAAEAALDSYLLKPHTATRAGASACCRRAAASACSADLRGDRRRRISTPPPACAASASSSRGEYWLYAARIGAELLLRLGHADEGALPLRGRARGQAPPWAKLGIARAEIEAGQQTGHAARWRR